MKTERSFFRTKTHSFFTFDNVFLMLSDKDKASVLPEKWLKFNTRGFFIFSIFFTASAICLCLNTQCDHGEGLALAGKTKGWFVLHTVVTTVQNRVITGGLLCFY